MAVFCGFLCVWSIRDAWFPTEKILKKHPREIPVAFKVSGVVKQIFVKPGEEIKGETALAGLYDETYRAKAAEAEAVFEAAKAAKDPSVEEKLDALMRARADLAACVIKNTDFTWKTTHGEDILRGTVFRIAAEAATHLDAGAPVMTIAPYDTFYQFNKTLSILSFIGMIAALIFHRIASR